MATEGTNERGREVRFARFASSASASFVILWSAFCLIVVAGALATGTVGIGDLGDAITLVVTAVVWLGGLALAARRAGWAGVKIRASFQGAYLGEAVRKWQEAEASAERLAAEAKVATDAVEQTPAPTARQQERVVALTKRVADAAELVKMRRRLAGEAMKKMHEAAPEDAQLAEDFRALFPELAGMEQPSAPSH